MAAKGQSSDKHTQHEELQYPADKLTTFSGASSFEPVKHLFLHTLVHDLADVATRLLQPTVQMVK